MRRTQYKVPGYQEAQSCHGEQWHYVVLSDDERVALVLVVGSGVFPPEASADRTLARKGAVGYSLDLHVGFPTSRDDVREGRPSTECRHVRGGRCHRVMSTAIGARKFVEKFFAPVGYEQPDRFWRELETRLVQIMRHVSDASEQWARCPHCDATGTIAR